MNTHHSQSDYWELQPFQITAHSGFDRLTVGKWRIYSVRKLCHTHAKITADNVSTRLWCTVSCFWFIISSFVFFLVAHTYFIASFSCSYKDNKIFEYAVTISCISCFSCTTSSEYETLSGSKLWHAVQQLCHCDAMNPQLERNWQSGYWWQLARSRAGWRPPRLLIWWLEAQHRED